MNAYINFLNDLINKNNFQYPKFNDQINWVNYYEALEKEELKNKLIKKLQHKLNWSFKNTKPWINTLSKGCRLCGEGNWSCLFITGKCNAKCFYCPTSQNIDGIPSTQSTSFNNVDDYIQYLEYFDFKGAGLSGGEPLIVFDRTLDYVKKIKKHFGDKMYLWIYTNGILGSKEMYEKLTNAGLDEIRFDIGASNYDLKYIKLVKNSISNISVEIPAVPEELEQLKQILPELIEIGVTNLNLHQLRLTNYNAPKILQKNYTCLHGEQATILESELTALKIIEFVADNNLKIGVNYCAFHFKNRFQKAGFRKRIASKFTEPNLQLTDNGFLRSISNNGSLYIIENNKLISENNELTENHQHFEIKYRGLILDDKPDNTQYLKKIIIGSKTYFLKSGPTQTAVKADQNQIFKFLKLFDNNGSVIPEDKDLFALWKNEFIEWNLREYF